MRIFLSWSGYASKQIASKMVEWLPHVVPASKPWMSGHHIQSGTLWDQELSQNLQSTDCALLLLTRENQNAPWLLYEAGVLSRTAIQQRIIPYQIDVQRDAIAPPLTRFQGIEATDEGTRKLVEDLNSLLPEPAPLKRLHTLFDVFWPILQSVIADALVPPPGTPAMRREIVDYLEEILTLARGIHGDAQPAASHSPSQYSPEEALRARAISIAESINSMEDYERKGGGASTESWWDAYVDRHREARDLYLQALALVERASKIR